MFYLIYALPALVSVLLITENRAIGWIGEKLFRLRKDSFYDRNQRHWWRVALFRWPFFLALVGHILPILVWWDFLVMLGFGIIWEWKHHRNQNPENPKQLPATVVGKTGVIEL